MFGVVQYVPLWGRDTCYYGFSATEALKLELNRRWSSKGACVFTEDILLSVARQVPLLLWDRLLYSMGLGEALALIPLLPERRPACQESPVV